MVEGFAQGMCGDMPVSDELINQFRSELDLAQEEKDISDSQQPREPIEGKERLVDQLKEAISMLDFDSRSALGQTFAAYLKGHPEDAKKYSEPQATGQAHKHKKDFRD